MPEFQYQCTNCDRIALRWEGRCSSCGEWGSLEETVVTPHNVKLMFEPNKVPPIVELSKIDDREDLRYKFSSKELNMVFGGGLIPGSVTLIAGDPGVGKSTLLLKIASQICSENKKVAYISGEESTFQLKSRSKRLGISGSYMYVLETSSINYILTQLNELKPKVVVIDSVNTLYDDTVESPIGSINQLKSSVSRLTQWAKSKDTPVILVGHVTKGGDIAGPRVLEHMVDTVMYMESERLGINRILRSTKNRFGSTNEIAIFSMDKNGLNDLKDPSKAFLSDINSNHVGSSMIIVLHGTRPIIVEIQVLTSKSYSPIPRRISTGVEIERILLLTTVLNRKLGLKIASQDLIVNVTGGFKVTETAGDLGICMAIISSLLNEPLKSHLAIIGEIGLTGEIRQVPYMGKRINDAIKLGFKRLLVPNFNFKEVIDVDSDSIELIRSDTLYDAATAIFGSRLLNGEK